jgi:hypothetical protein
MSAVTAAPCGIQSLTTQCSANPFPTDPADPAACTGNSGESCTADCLDKYEGGYTATCETGIWLYEGCCTLGELWGHSTWGHPLVCSCQGFTGPLQPYVPQEAAVTQGCTERTEALVSDTQTRIRTHAIVMAIGPG